MIPGSKSLSNRILLLAALAKGTTVIENLLDADDIHVMLEALTKLGVRVEYEPKSRSCTVYGNGGPFRTDGMELFLGNAGTAMRPLAAVLSAGAGTYRLYGEPRMHERPIGHLVDGLRSIGADIRYEGKAGYPPLSIHAKTLVGGDCIIDASVSSQFLSAMLLAAPLAGHATTIGLSGELVSGPYVDMTINLMHRFGIQVKRDSINRYEVPGGLPYCSPGYALVEGDASSASYFLAAGAIRGGTVTVHGVGKDSVQGDVQFADVLERMGAIVRRGDSWIEVTRGKLRGISVDATEFPDAAMTLATTALFAEGATEIRGIANWRVKETDRLAAMATELGKVGAGIKAGDDFITIDPPPKLLPATIETYKDHRMAMCFSLAALGESPMTILDPYVTSKTFPNYFSQFLMLTGAIPA